MQHRDETYIHSAEYDDYDEYRSASEPEEEDVDYGFELDLNGGGRERSVVAETDTFTITADRVDDTRRTTTNERDSGDYSVGGASANEYQQEMGSFQYMPRKFAGLDTSKLGFHISGRKVSPFIELKEKIINEGKNMTIEDRMKGVRYMSNIPYANKEAHCLEAALSIIRDETIDIYTRFYFFSSKDKFYRLDDHTVYYIYGGFLKQAERAGPARIPYELVRLTVQYILQNYSPDMASRQNALDWCLNLIEDEHEDIGSKLEAIRLLLQCGDMDERQFAQDQLEAQFEIQDINAIELDDKDVRDLLRGLRTRHRVLTGAGGDTPAALFEACCKANVESGADVLQSLDDFFNDVVSGPIKFEGISIADVLVMWYKEVQTLDKYKQEECLYQFTNVATDGNIDNEDIIPNVIRILADFSQPRPFFLGPTLMERLRNDIFAALNRSLYSLNEGVRAEVEASRESEDKAAVKEFLFYFDDEKDILYKQYTQELTREQFNQWFDKICNDWIHC